MAALGILLVLCAGAYIADVAITNSMSTQLDMFNNTVTGLTNGTTLLIGAAAGFLLAVGLGMMIAGMSRRARRRRAHRDALAEQRAETERLALELERERAARASTYDEPVATYPSEPVTIAQPTEHRVDTTASATAERPVDGTVDSAVDGHGHRRR